jgi:pimeloyl-ACP methyl ester carboxylesterase
MQIIDRGSGTPIVLVPGVQGRWEYAAPAVDALARSFRVITFPLCGEPGCPPFEPSKGIDSFSDQIASVLDACGLERAIICGISFGGLAALRFAAERPERTQGLVLVSTPGPGWRLKKRHQLYSRAPWIFGPLFLAETPRRLRREVAAAIPLRRERVRFAWGQLRALVRAPITFARMAERAELIATIDFAAEAARVSAPTLVVSGEARLDYVVPADGTSQYARLIRGARAVRLDRTGHLGSITKPDVFASVVRSFVESMQAAPHEQAERGDGVPAKRVRGAGAPGVNNDAA